MKTTLALAVILGFGLSASAQQVVTQQRRPVHPHVLPNWVGPPPAIVPIPNWSTNPTQQDTFSAAPLIRPMQPASTSDQDQTVEHFSSVVFLSPSEFPNAHIIPNWPENPPSALSVTIEHSAAQTSDAAGQAGQDKPQPPKPQPIPNWGANKPAPIEQIPTTWVRPSGEGWVSNGNGVMTFSLVPTRPCAIYRKNGGGYQFLEGTLPGSMKPQKHAAGKTIRAITEAGGTVKILDYKPTQDEIDAARASCR